MDDNLAGKQQILDRKESATLIFGDQTAATKNLPQLDQNDGYPKWVQRIRPWVVELLIGAHQRSG